MISDSLEIFDRNSADTEFLVYPDTVHLGIVGLVDHTDIGPQNVNRMFAYNFDRHNLVGLSQADLLLIMNTDL